MSIPAGAQQIDEVARRLSLLIPGTAVIEAQIRDELHEVTKDYPSFAEDDARRAREAGSRPAPPPEAEAEADLRRIFGGVAERLGAAVVEVEHLPDPVPQETPGIQGVGDRPQRRPTGGAEKPGLWDADPELAKSLHELFLRSARETPGRDSWTDYCDRLMERPHPVTGALRLIPRATRRVLREAQFAAWSARERYRPTVLLDAGHPPDGSLISFLQSVAIALSRGEPHGVLRESATQFGREADVALGWSDGHVDWEDLAAVVVKYVDVAGR